MTQNNKKLNFKVANYVVRRFTGKWEGLYTNALQGARDSILEEWARVLIGYTEQDVDTALSYITTDPNWRERSKYPPGKIEFVELMKSLRKKKHERPNPEIETAKEYLQDARNKLSERLATYPEEQKSHAMDLLHGWGGVGITGIISDYEFQRVPKPRICCDCEKYAAWFSLTVKKPFCVKHFFEKRNAGEKI